MPSPENITLVTDPGRSRFNAEEKLLVDRMETAGRNMARWAKTRGFFYTDIFNTFERKAGTLFLLVLAENHFPEEEVAQALQRTVRVEVDEKKPDQISSEFRARFYAVGSDQFLQASFVQRTTIGMITPGECKPTEISFTYGQPDPYLDLRYTYDVVRSVGKLEVVESLGGAYRSLCEVKGRNMDINTRQWADNVPHNFVDVLPGYDLTAGKRLANAMINGVSLKPAAKQTPASFREDAFALIRWAVGLKKRQVFPSGRF